MSGFQIPGGSENLAPKHIGNPGSIGKFRRIGNLWQYSCATCAKGPKKNSSPCLHRAPFAS